MKTLLKNHPLTHHLYMSARTVYLLFYNTIIKFLKAWVRWRSKKQGYRTFRWHAHTIREEWETSYTVGNIISNLGEFTAMADMAKNICGPAPIIVDVGANNIENIIPINIGLSDRKATMLIGPPSLDSDSGSLTVHHDREDMGLPSKGAPLD